MSLTRFTSPHTKKLVTAERGGGSEGVSEEGRGGGREGWR